LTIAGPNPWKVAILLEELNVPYTTKVYTTPELKPPDFLALNPNGMAPVIDDPNTGLLLGESGAIMDYVLDQ
jgi:glutathione S-transferase